MSCSSSVISSLYESEIAVTTLPSGRKIYRHPTLPGSVLMFNDGVDRSVLVLDAKYRINNKIWGLNTVPITTLAKLEINPQPFYLNTLEGYDTNSVTDTILNSVICDPNTSTFNTNKLFELYDPATMNETPYLPETLLYCRSVVIGDELSCDVPNINTTLRIFLDRSYIDALDPTIATYSNLSLEAIWMTNEMPRLVWSSSIANVETNADLTAIPVISLGNVAINSFNRGQAGTAIPTLEL